MIENDSSPVNGVIAGLTSGGLVGVITGSTILGIDGAALAVGATVGVTAGVAVAAIAFVVVGSLIALGGIGYGIYRLVRHLSK